jgi:hypothetical protein
MKMTILLSLAIFIFTSDGLAQTGAVGAFPIAPPPHIAPQQNGSQRNQTKVSAGPAVDKAAVVRFINVNRPRDAVLS